MSDEDDIEKTQLGQPEVDAEPEPDEGEELTDTIITGMPAFELPPELAEAAVDAAVFPDDEELGPEDTDETMISDGEDTDGGAGDGADTGEVALGAGDGDDAADGDEQE